MTDNKTTEAVKELLAVKKRVAYYGINGKRHWTEPILKKYLRMEEALALILDHQSDEDKGNRCGVCENTAESALSFDPLSESNS